MMEKLFGPPPEDLDDKRWRLHWASGMASLIAVTAVVALFSFLWFWSKGLTVGSVN